MTADVIDDCFAGGVAHVVFFKRISFVRKSLASMFPSRHGSFGSLNELELSSQSNDFSEGDERNELLVLLDKFDDGSKLRSKFNSSVDQKEMILYVRSLGSSRSNVHIPFSVVASFSFDETKLGVDISCKLLYDFNRCERLSCCNSSRVGAGLKTVSV